MILPSDPERWAQVRSVFDNVVDRDGIARERELAALAQSDPDLAQAVQQLLDADSLADERLQDLERAFSTSGSSNDPDPLHLRGRTISHFRVIEPLGGGGMGVVYRAEDLNLGRLAALKFPLPHRGISRQIRERFLHEARFAAKVDHRNLCSIYETGETEDGHLFIAMPLYQGETLRERLRRDNSLSIADALGVARQTAEGLTAAHKAGIVHRDLKPANIMLLEDGTVKILDFGLAKVSDLTLTTSSLRVGTAAYMAPEQIDGGVVDGRADLWALGVVLYEMIAGARPFDGTNDISIAYSILHKPAPALAAQRPQISGRLEGLVSKLLAKNPDHRFASAAEVISEIDAVLRSPGDKASSKNRHVFRQLPRRRTAVTALLAAISAVATAYFLWNERKPSSSSSLDSAVAILPFSFHGDTAASYVAAGIGAEVAALLMRMKSLRIVNKTAAPHMLSDDSLPALAKRLRAPMLVKADVERSGAGVTVLATVIDTRTLPAGSSQTRIEIESPTIHDAAGTVTLRILDALRIRPSPAERALISKRPTASGVAYDWYLKGRRAELAPARAGPSVDRLLGAQPFYWRARELDPQFARARARLALTHAQIALAGEDRSETRREQARIEAEAALRLEADLPEAHIAFGHYWSIRRDDSRALASLRKAMELAPSEPGIHVDAALIHRRNGRWEEAALEFQRALELEPDNSAAAQQAAVSFSRMRRYSDAIRMWNHALSIDPNNYAGWVIRGQAYLRWQGQVDTLEAALDRIPAGWDEAGFRTWTRVTVSRIRRRFADALPALDKAALFPNDGLLYRPVPLLRGQLYAELGDARQAAKHFRIAEQILRDSVTARPDNPAAHIALGLAYAGLGKADLAKREARRAMELAPLAQNAMVATAFAGGAAEIYAALGENDEALKLLGLLLAMPAGREVSVPLLRADPTWDPLRKDPRFARLLQQYSAGEVAPPANR